MILFIDTASFEEVRFALVGKQIKERSYALPHSKPSETIKLLAKFLGKTKLEGVEKIYVVSGPGSFSGIRVGLAIAQAFAFAKQVPAYALTKEQIPQSLAKLTELKKLKKVTASFDPEYGAAPNITMSKKHYGQS
jgi:tRNA A37 threonylcarbamoyladenosine modification protein TsaB